MRPSAAQKLISEELPYCHRRLLVAAIIRAYCAVERLVASNPMLAVPSAVKGCFIPWAIDYEVQILLESGDLPYSFAWKFYDKPTGKYLCINLRHSTMSINQVASSSEVPREACFRKQYAITNQMQLPGMEDQVNQTGLPHINLVHGHKSLNFVHLGMQTYADKGWLAKSENLIDIAQEPIEYIQDERDLSLKENLLSRLKVMHEG